MQVKLKQARAGHLIGERLKPSAERATAIKNGLEIEQPEYEILGSISNEKGDVIEVADAEGARMIKAGQAVAFAERK